MMNGGILCLSRRFHTNFQVFYTAQPALLTDNTRLCLYHHTLSFTFSLLLGNNAETEAETVTPLSKLKRAAAISAPYGLYGTWATMLEPYGVVWVKDVFWLLPYKAHLMVGTCEIC